MIWLERWGGDGGEEFSENKTVVEGDLIMMRRENDVMGEVCSSSSVYSSYRKKGMDQNSTITERAMVAKKDLARRADM